MKLCDKCKRPPSERVINELRWGREVVERCTDPIHDLADEAPELMARLLRLEEAQRRTLSGPEPTDNMDLLRDWRDSVVARAAAAGMPKGVGLCEWFEGLAAKHQSRK